MKPLNIAQPSHTVARSNVQRACWLMLGSLLALPVGAVQEKGFSDPDLNSTGRRVGPVAAVTPVFNLSTPKTPKGFVTQGIGPEKLTPPGAGPAVPQARVVNATPLPLPGAPVRSPRLIDINPNTLQQANTPPQGAGNIGVSVADSGVSPPVKGGPGPGAGGTPPRLGQNPTPGAGNVFVPDPTMSRVSPDLPTQGAGPSIASPVQPPAAARTNPAPTNSAATTLAPTSSAPAGAPIRPQGMGTQGGGPSANTVSLAPQPVQQGNRTIEPSAGLGDVASLSTSNTTLLPVAKIVEILPGLQKLSESMRELPPGRQQGIDSDALAAASNDKCVSVSLRPDTQRPGLNLVDLTGDGLIVSAVPDAHIQSVFAKAGYGQVDLSQTARWCITQTAARALVRPSSGAGIQQAALLVQTGTSLQLMSQDQWLAHQASVKPLVAAMATSSKPTKPSKPAYKLVAKRSGKPSSTGVAVSALRLPASTSKTNAGA
jgi:hypothetical protein